MYNILLVEDEEVTRKQVNKIMESYCTTDTASSLSQAEKLINNKKYDLIVLDLSLPDGNGLDFLKKHENEDREFIILSGDNSLEAKEESFNLGIHDYITKPFNPQEFQIRLKAKLKYLEFNKIHKQSIDLGNLHINTALHKVILNPQGKKQIIDLSNIEYKILSYYMRHPDKILPREEVIKEVWDGVYVESRTIDSHISKIKKKLKGSQYTFESVYREGYQFKNKGENND